MHIVALVCCCLLILGCLLPWVQWGLGTTRGFDSPDGALVMVAAVISGAVSLYNAVKNESRLVAVYILTALVGLFVAIVDLGAVHDQARAIAEAAGELSQFLGLGSEVSRWTFVGAGLYVILISSVGLLVVGMASISSVVGIASISFRRRIAPIFAGIGTEDGELEPKWKPPVGKLADGTACTHEGENSNYCTRCWTAIKPGAD